LSLDEDRADHYQQYSVIDNSNAVLHNLVLREVGSQRLEPKHNIGIVADVADRSHTSSHGF
jgi:hypothetical protein